MAALPPNLRRTLGTEVQAMTEATSSYLIPAIFELPGLLGYYVGASPDGEKAGVSFKPIVNYPVSWVV
jgi:hypothetical protein